MSKYQFEDKYPHVDKLGLFSKRKEISHLLRGESYQPLISRIEKTFPGSRFKDEIIITTYFESVYAFEPKNTCVARFRQRVSLISPLKKFSAPKKWELSGPGALETKLRSVDRLKVNKSSTFLPSQGRTNLKSLLDIILSEIHVKSRLIAFINKANHKQRLSTDPEDRKYLHLIKSDTLLATYKFLYPQFTRVNVRRTYTLCGVENVKVTVDTHPNYYAYPIMHKAHHSTYFKSEYIATFMENPDKAKVEIKAPSLATTGKVDKKFSSIFVKYSTNDPQLASVPFPTMTVELSKKVGALINESPGYEVETKANLLQQTDIKKTIERIRNNLIKKHKSNYLLFPSEPRIASRGDLEKHRTIFGWKDSSGKWHEAVRITRLTKEGVLKLGFSAILKQKGNQESEKTSVLVRSEKKEYLKKDVSDKQILKKFSAKFGSKLKIIGSIRKYKHRIIVQDRDGRNYVVSLDEVKILGTKQILQQLEVEYIHTVVVGKRKKLDTTVEFGCKQCTNYFIKELAGIGVEVEPTKLRKIDFLGQFT